MGPDDDPSGPVAGLGTDTRAATDTAGLSPATTGPSSDEANPDTETARRVMIVDGDRRVRRSLAGMLEASGRMEVVAGVSSAGEALEAVVTARPDIVLIDLDRPDGDAWLALIARLRMLWPPCSIAVMSEAMTLRACALAAGADEFINKWSPLDEICERIARLAGVPCDGATEPVGGRGAA